MNVYVGLDVGSRSVAMAWRQKGHTAGTWYIEQTPKGHALATKKLLKLKPVCVVMEATGIYGNSEKDFPNLVKYTHPVFRVA